MQTEVKEPEADGKNGHGRVTVTVNNKPVTLAKHRVTGLEVKQAAIAQGVEIELDFQLTLEAHDVMCGSTWWRYRFMRARRRGRGTSS